MERELPSQRVDHSPNGLDSSEPGELVIRSSAPQNLHAFIQRWILVILIIFKGLYFLGLLWGLALWGDLNLAGFQTAMARWPRDGNPQFASHFATWDCAHYLYLSEVGYHRDVPSCAFYPLWPYLVRWVSEVTLTSHVFTGTLLANVCSLGAWLILYRIILGRLGPVVASWSLAFLVAFPGSLFFQFNYTESLFLLLSVLLWWSLDFRRYIWSFIAAFLLPMTRGPGIFVILPITFYLLGHFSTPNQRCGSSANPTPAPHPKMQAIRFCGSGLTTCSILAAPFLGWIAYLALMWHWTGNPFEGLTAQKYWDVHSVMNLINVPKFIVGFFSARDWHSFRGSVLDRCVFLPLIYTLPVLWKVDRKLIIWVYALGILPAMSGTFTSFTRFASCVFPLFLAMGIVFSDHKLRWPRYALLTLFSVLHIVLVWRFINFQWAG